MSLYNNISKHNSENTKYIDNRHNRNVINKALLDYSYQMKELHEIIFMKIMDITGISLVYVFQKYENQIYSYFTFIKSVAS